MSDFESGELQAFRRQARAWLEENAPASIRGAPPPTAEQLEGGVTPTADEDLWRRRMGEKGWGVPTWPKLPTTGLTFESTRPEG